MGTASSYSRDCLQQRQECKHRPHTFQLICGHYPWVAYKEDLDLRSKSKTAEKLSSKLRNLMAICQQNLHHTQELPK